MRQAFVLFVGMLPCMVTFAQSRDLPSDSLATKETVSLYRHLRALPGKGFLFGHQDDLAYGVGWKYIPGRSDIKDVTGDCPTLYGWELGRIELDHPVNIDCVPFDQMKAFIREGFERGGVITISWHLNNPLTGGTAWQPAPGHGSIHSARRGKARAIFGLASAADFIRFYADDRTLFQQDAAKEKLYD